MFLDVKAACTFAMASKTTKSASGENIVWRRIHRKTLETQAWAPHVARFFVSDFKTTVQALKTAQSYMWGLTGCGRLAAALDHKKIQGKQQKTPLLVEKYKFVKFGITHEHGGCAIDQKGRAWTWGLTRSPVVVDIGEDTFKVKEITMGHDRYLLVTTNGRVYKVNKSGKWVLKYSGGNAVSCCSKSFDHYFLTSDGSVFDVSNSNTPINSQVYKKIMFYL